MNFSLIQFMPLFPFILSLSLCPDYADLSFMAVLSNMAQTTLLIYHVCIWLGPSTIFFLRALHCPFAGQSTHQVWSLPTVVAKRKENAQDFANHIFWFFFSDWWVGLIHSSIWKKNGTRASEMHAIVSVNLQHFFQLSLSSASLKSKSYAGAVMEDIWFYQMFICLQLYLLGNTFVGAPIRRIPPTKMVWWSVGRSIEWSVGSNSLFFFYRQ